MAICNKFGRWSQSNWHMKMVHTNVDEADEQDRVENTSKEKESLSEDEELLIKSEEVDVWKVMCCSFDL